MKGHKTNALRRLKFGLIGGAGSLLVALPAMASLGSDLKEKASTVAGGAGLNTGSSQTLPQMVGAIIQGAMGLIGVILVVFFIYAGFLWMTAQGNPENIDKAKAIIKDATIGLAILLASYAITSFILTAVLNATGTQ